MAKAKKHTIVNADARTDLGLKPNGRRWSAACKYQPEYCDSICDLMSGGLTYVEVARELKVSHKTMIGWCKDFPEFAEAYEMGFELAEAYYQTKARKFLVGYREPNGPIETFDTKQFMYVMKSRFKQYDTPKAVNVNIHGADMDTVRALMDEYTKDLYKDTI